jgi:hypothetical protein
MLASLIDWSSLQAVLANPAVLGGIFAVLRNLAGYIYNCIEAKQILPYSASQFLVTLGMWEMLFIALAGVGNLDTTTTAAIAFGLDFIRSLKTAIVNATKAVTA